MYLTFQNAKFFCSISAHYYTYIKMERLVGINQKSIGMDGIYKIKK